MSAGCFGSCDVPTPSPSPSTNLHGCTATDRGTGNSINTDWVSPIHVKNTNFCFKTPDPPPFKKLLNETDSLYFNKSDSNLNETNYLNETNFLNETLNETPNGKLNKTLTDVFYNPISPILSPTETLSTLLSKLPISPIEINSPNNIKFEKLENKNDR